LRGGAADEAISKKRQGLLRSACNDSLAYPHAMSCDRSLKKSNSVACQSLAMPGTLYARRKE